MSTGNHTRWFFVTHLEESDRPSIDMRYEIQLLNAEGQAVACGYLDDHADTLEIQGRSIPLAVVEAARRQVIGKGDHVDQAGNSVSPF
jgi:hypothetical protein